MARHAYQPSRVRSAFSVSLYVQATQTFPLAVLFFVYILCLTFLTTCFPSSSFVEHTYSAMKTLFNSVQ
jgi:hypothetical protein